MDPSTTRRTLDRIAELQRHADEERLARHARATATIVEQRQEPSSVTPARPCPGATGPQAI